MLAVLGCDFSSSPSRRKPIVLAWGRCQGARLHLDRLQRCDTLTEWGQLMAQDGDWVGGFDLPFGLPRALVTQLNWPLDWRACMAHYASLDRAQIRASFKAFCDARPVGHKFAHRATDGPAGSSPSMKWVNPPVAFMLHAGVPLLIKPACIFQVYTQVTRAALRSKPTRVSWPVRCWVGAVTKATTAPNKPPSV